MSTPASTARTRTTILDFRLALARVDDVLAAGEPVHRGRWRRQAVAEHVRHAFDHLAVWQAGDSTEDHLAHAGCRLLMALQIAGEEATR